MPVADGGEDLLASIVRGVHSTSIDLVSCQMEFEDMQGPYTVVIGRSKS
jgi:hypothetical protein